MMMYDLGSWIKQLCSKSPEAIMSNPLAYCAAPANEAGFLAMIYVSVRDALLAQLGVKKLFR